MSESSLLCKLPAAELAQNSVVRFFFKLGLLLRWDAVSIHFFASHCANPFAQLHALQLPLRYFTSLRLRLYYRFLLLSLFFRVVVFFNALAVRVCCLPVLCDIKFFAFLYEHLLTNFAMLDDCLFIEFTATIVAREKTADICVLCRLFVVLNSAWISCWFINLALLRPELLLLLLRVLGWQSGSCFLGDLFLLHRAYAVSWLWLSDLCVLHMPTIIWTLICIWVSWVLLVVLDRSDIPLRRIFAFRLVDWILHLDLPALHLSMK